MLWLIDAHNLPCKLAPFVRITTGWQRRFSIWPQIAKADPGATVTAVWRDPNHLDLFTTGTDGTVWSAWWEAGPGWQQWFPIWPQVAKANPGAAVTALWRDPEHLDLFITGTDGTQIYAVWDDGNAGFQQSISLPNKKRPSCEQGGLVHDREILGAALAESSFQLAQ